VRRVDFEIYGLSVYALVVSRYPCSFILNLTLDIRKFCEPSIWDVVEFCPLWLCCYTSRGMWFRSIVIGGNIDELQNQRSSSDDTAATGEEVSPDDILEDGGFARGLGTNNDLYGRISTKSFAREDNRTI
jgi:hypothetical protein